MYLHLSYIFCFLSKSKVNRGITGVALSWCHQYTQTMNLPDSVCQEEQLSDLMKILYMCLKCLKMPYYISNAYLKYPISWKISKKRHFRHENSLPVLLFYLSYIRNFHYLPHSWIEIKVPGFWALCGPRVKI